MAELVHSLWRNLLEDNILVQLPGINSVNIASFLCLNFPRMFLMNLCL